MSNERVVESRIAEPGNLSPGERVGGVRRIALGERGWRDHRGWGAAPLLAAGLDSGPADLHVVSLKPAAVRGNHLHPSSTEWMLVCDGPVEVVWRADVALPPQRELVGPDDPTLFVIPPGCEHAVRNLAGHDVIVVSFGNVHKPEQIRCDPPLIPPPIRTARL